MEPARKADIPDIDFDLLPRSLCELVRVIGLAAATRLLQRFGGRTIFVPAEVSQDHPLSVALGHQVAQRLCANYGRDQLDVPQFESLLRGMRDAEIRRRRCAGESPSTLASEYFLTVRQIRRIASLAEDQPK
jgi:Mor family transcriptional regulator